MEQLRKFLFAFALLATTVSCIGAQSLDGTWRSEGYGWVFDIHGDSLRAREVTAASCIASFRAHRTTPVPVGAVAAFTFDDSPVTVQVLRGTSADVMRLHLEGFRRPCRCRRSRRRISRRDAIRGSSGRCRWCEAARNCAR